MVFIGTTHPTDFFFLFPHLLSLPYLIRILFLIFCIGEGEVCMLGGNHLGVLSDLQNISPAKHLPRNAFE